MSHILHGALHSIRRLRPIHSSRSIYTNSSKSISQRQTLIRKSRNARLADEPYERRIEAGRINGLIWNINRYVASGNHDYRPEIRLAQLSTEKIP